jgi:hypothetical protein
VEKAGWAPGPVGMGVVKRKSLAPTDVCTWDCPLHRKSFYHLHKLSPVVPVQAPETHLSSNCAIINPLMPELNPSAQRCLTRFFTGDFASWTVHL